MQRLAQIVEFTRKELLNAVDPSFIHHAQYYKELPVKSATGARYRGIKLVRVDGYLQYEVISMATDGCSHTKTKVGREHTR